MFTVLVSLVVSFSYAEPPSFSAPSLFDAPKVEPKSPFQWSVPERAVERIDVVLAVPSGHAVYRDRLAVRALAGRIGKVQFPEPLLMPDLYDPGSFRAAYQSNIVVRIPVEAVEKGRVILELEQQGCTKGLCWPIAVTQHEVKVVLVEETP